MNVFQKMISYTQEIFHCNIGQYYSLSTHASDFHIISCNIFVMLTSKLGKVIVYTFSLMKSEL